MEPNKFSKEISRTESDPPPPPLPGFCGARERSGFWLNAVAATLTAISVFLLVRYSDGASHPRVAAAEAFEQALSFWTAFIYQNAVGGYLAIAWDAD